jgi:hypothetical protein
VENYCNVFHHFNFKVKIENPITSVSRVSLFFAEIREMFGQKYYFCSPLESDSENGTNPFLSESNSEIFLVSYKSLPD